MLAPAHEPDADGVLLLKPRKRIGPWVVAAVVVSIALIVGVSLYMMRQPRAPAATSVKLSPIPPKVEEQRLMPIAEETARTINAARPYDLAAPPPARKFVFAGDDLARARATACLAAAAWWEAGDDSVGQKSVMQVVLNRERHPAFPGGVCATVFQGSERQTGCQFTFTCDGALARTPSAAAWERATERASAMLSGEVFAPVGWATHYHTDWVVPYWAPSLTKAAKVQTHIFYLWRGWWGTRPAFSRARGSAEPAIAALARFSNAHRTGAEGEEALLATDPGVEISATLDLPPIELEGVSKRSLGTALVRSRETSDDQFFVELDANAFPGSYAISALAICKGKPKCTVFGWRDRSAMARSMPLDDIHRVTLSFFYARSEEGERALWNCTQAPRPNRAQCLPADASAIAAVTG